MKKLLGFVFLLLFIAVPAFGQASNGNITASGSTCATPNACVVLNLLNTAGGATITLTGTFSATLQFEVSGDFGVTWTAASTASSTSTGVTNISVAGYTTLRVRCSTYVSGTVNATIYSGAGSIRQSAGGSGTVTSVLGSSPIASDGNTTTPTISCPTCSTSAGIALQTNGVANGSQTLLNLAGSTNLTVTDNGSGTVTLAVTGLAVAPQNTPFVANQFLTAYNSTTGAFTQTGTCGVAGTTSCVITGAGSSSGTATITWPAVSGTITNAIAFSNAISSAANIISGGASGFFVGGNSGCKSAANGRLNCDNQAFNTNGLTRFTFGTEVASAPAFTFDGATDIVKTSDGTGDTTKGNFSSALFKTDTNCAISSVSPAACAGASAGQVAVPTAATTYTVNTTAVTANSEIFIQQDTSTTAGTRLGVTCNTAVSTALPLLTAKVAATSFTFSLTAPITNPDCFSYHIIN